MTLTAKFKAAKVIGGVMGAVILTILAGFFFYFNHAERQKSVLAAELAAAEASNAANKETIRAMNENMVRQANSLDRLNRELARIRQESSDLARIILEGNIGDQAKQDPEVLEKRLNEATAAWARAIEEATNPLTYQRPPGGRKNDR